jgi:hypothetical protein
VLETSGAVNGRRSEDFAAGGHAVCDTAVHKELDMRILTLRRMIGIAAIGVAYVHGKRGGDATWASISDTLRYVYSSACDRLGVGKDQQRAMPGRTASPRISNPNGPANERTPRPPGS